MKKQNYILLFSGLLLVLIPFAIRQYSILKLISVLLGMVLVLLGLIIYQPKKVVKTLFYPLLLSGLILTLDFLLAFYFECIPIISLKVESSSSVINYNSLFYRVFSCENDNYFDKYNHPYMCRNDLLPKVSINSFLETPAISFESNKGKFIHLEGKVSKIIGDSKLVLNSYIEPIELNGYVSFDNTKKVIVENLTIVPSDYHIYDLIEVIGLVNNYSSEDGEVIYLTDAIIVKSLVYDSYEEIVYESDDLTKKDITEKISYWGIDNVYYKYDENNIYELNYLLLDKRITISGLVKGVPYEIIDDIKLYKLENYNLVVCDNLDINFVNKKISSWVNICK